MRPVLAGVCSASGSLCRSDHGSKRPPKIADVGRKKLEAPEILFFIDPIYFQILFSRLQGSAKIRSDRTNKIGSIKHKIAGASKNASVLKRRVRKGERGQKHRHEKDVRPRRKQPQLSMMCKWTWPFWGDRLPEVTQKPFLSPRSLFL